MTSRSLKSRTALKQTQRVPDSRESALNEATALLKKAGAETISVIATWPGKDTRSKIVFDLKKRGLGKGISAITSDVKSGDKRTTVLG